MTTESNQPILITQARLTQLAVEAFNEMLERRRKTEEEIRAQRRAAKLAAWNKRQPKGERG